jgi:hypothetical protein
MGHGRRSEQPRPFDIEVEESHGLESNPYLHGYVGL